MSAIVYILYNANASVLGKMQYAFKKIKAPPSESPCAACDLTHGGLRLSETDEWTNTKKRIGAEVHQLHKDEASKEILEFVKAQNTTYPLVLARQSAQDPLKLVMSTKDLATCSKNHEEFLSLLGKNAKAEGIDVAIASGP